MIVLGALARLKDVVPKEFLPTESEGFLTSINVTNAQKQKTIVRAVGKEDSVGYFENNQQRMEIGFNYICTYTTAKKYFELAAHGMAKKSGQINLDSIPFMSENSLIPLCISSVSMATQANSPATFTITYEYFHRDITDLEASPIQAELISETIDDHAIDITLDADDLPIESMNFTISGNYEILFDLEGYFGIKYGIATLSQAITYFDDQFEPTFPFDAFYDQLTKIDTTSSSIQSGGKQMLVLSRQGNIAHES